MNSERGGFESSSCVLRVNVEQPRGTIAMRDSEPAVEGASRVGGTANQQLAEHLELAELHTQAAKLKRFNCAGV